MTSLTVHYLGLWCPYYCSWSHLLTWSHVCLDDYREQCQLVMKQSLLIKARQDCVADFIGRMNALWFYSAKLHARIFVSKMLTVFCLVSMYFLDTTFSYWHGKPCEGALQTLSLITKSMYEPRLLSKQYTVRLLTTVQFRVFLNL